LCPKVGRRPASTEFFCGSVLPHIKRNICDGRRRKTLRGIYLHLDNPPPHNAKRSRQEIAQIKAKLITYPAHSPDGTLSDFFLFGNFKREMAGFTSSSAEDILSEIDRIFKQSPKAILTAVYNE
jgi:hypothetical protein